jgi:hypothetical protein
LSGEVSGGIAKNEAKSKYFCYLFKFNPIIFFNHTSIYEVKHFCLFGAKKKRANNIKKKTFFKLLTIEREKHLFPSPPPSPSLPLVRFHFAMLSIFYSLYHAASEELLAQKVCFSLPILSRFVFDSSTGSSHEKQCVMRDVKR